MSIANAAFADPAACAGGQACEGLFLTAATGVLRFGNEQLRAPGIVLVQVAPSTVYDGNLEAIGEPTTNGCTTEAAVRIDNNLGTGRASSFGRVPLMQFVQNEDGSFTCDAPNGQWLDLNAVWTGVGDTQATASRSQMATPWMHLVEQGREAFRAATVSSTITLNDANVAWPLWPGSASMGTVGFRSMTIEHSHAVGPKTDRPVMVSPGGVLVSVAEGQADGFWVDAMTFTQDGTTLKTYVGLSGMLGEDFVWSESFTGTITLTPDLSTAAVSGVLTLFRESPEGPVAIGDVTLTATWSGVGDAWRFSAKGGYSSPEGKGSTITTGIHRDATFDLTLDGVHHDGTVSYLEAFTTKNAPKTI